MNRDDLINIYFKKVETLRSDVHKTGPMPADLHIEGDGPVSVYYAPFDYVNADARLVIVGITPGLHQAAVAVNEARASLRAGQAQEEALRRAKMAASFSGPMRGNLVRMLDTIGLPERIGAKRAGDLFADQGHRIHYTSVLRYPVLLNGQNYRGNPFPLGSQLLRSYVDRCLAEEARALAEAFWVPLGDVATQVLLHFAATNILKEEHILDGLPHPSPANAERIAYFLGRKERQALSARVNPDAIEARRVRLAGKLAGLPADVSAAATDKAIARETSGA